MSKRWVTVMLGGSVLVLAGCSEAPAGLTRVEGKAKTTCSGMVIHTGAGGTQDTTWTPAGCTPGEL